MMEQYLSQMYRQDVVSFARNCRNS